MSWLLLTTVLLTRKGFVGDGMDKPAQNIQDSFLNNARKDKIVLTIYLMSGVKLSGRIKSFDKYSLVLETNNQEQLIFKHAVSTVVTQKTSHSYASSPAPAVHSATDGSAPGVPSHADAAEA
jgi:host factor-I protein